MMTNLVCVLTEIRPASFGLVFSVEKIEKMKYIMKTFAGVRNGDPSEDLESYHIWKLLMLLRCQEVFIKGSPIL